MTKKSMIIGISTLAICLFVGLSSYVGERIYHELTDGTLAGMTPMYDINTHTTLYGFSEADYSGIPESEVNDQDNSYLPTTSDNPVNQLLIDGHYYNYVNAGGDMAPTVINASPTRLLATHGGASPLLVDDEQSTHLIGHNPGAFSILPMMKMGQTFTAYDATGKSEDYVVDEILELNYLNVDHSGKNYTSFLATPGDEEQLVLETDINKQGDKIVVVCHPK